MPAYCAPLFLPEFDLYQEEKVIDRGKTTVSNKSHAWNRGLTQSFMKLNCKPLQTGKTEKLLSTVDLFAGLDASHKLAREQIELRVRHTKVKPRLVEIWAMPKGECENLAPVVTTTSEFYTYAAKNIKNESHKFGENMSFRVKITPLGVTR